MAVLVGTQLLLSFGRCDGVLATRMLFDQVSTNCEEVAPVCEASNPLIAKR